MNLPDIDEYFKVKVTEGSVRLVIENHYNKRGDFIGGGYKINYDKKGKEVSRTDWEATGITITNPMKDVNYIMNLHKEIGI